MRGPFRAACPPPQGYRIWKMSCLEATGWILRDGVNNVETGAMDEISEAFGDLDDPRTGNAKRHLLHEVLIIALCTVLCGGETCADMSLFGRSKRAFLDEF